MQLKTIDKFLYKNDKNLSLNILNVGNLTSDYFKIIEINELKIVIFLKFFFFFGREYYIFESSI